ncbi:unnamed protein product [marine sediment metagenome]|uniref:Uncharacterized protein n=1 Tax=marine sediment metagenome TaxID=412755 RepID=X0SMF6_9ZZZZ
MKEFKCDCGFKWLEGKSGSHHCGPFYMEKVDGLRQELGAANSHIVELKEWVETSPQYRDPNILAKTPAQSLASIEAKAVMDAKSKFLGSGLLIDAQRINDFFNDYANKLLGDTK